MELTRRAADTVFPTIIETIADEERILRGSRQRGRVKQLVGRQGNRICDKVCLKVGETTAKIPTWGGVGWEKVTHKALMWEG